MAEHFATYTLSSSVSAAARAGQHPQHTFSRKGTLTFLDTDNPIISSSLNPGPLRTLCHLPNGGTIGPYVEVVSKITGAGGSTVVRGQFNQTWVEVDGAFADDDGQYIVREPFTTGCCRTNPDYRLEIDGAAETAVDAAVGDLAAGTWDYVATLQSPEPLTDFLHTAFGEFEERPNDTAASGAERLRELSREMTQGSSYQLGVSALGVPIVARQANYAAMSATGEIYVLPGDLGAGVDQIPNASTLGNTAAKFRLYPTVFLRRTDYLRSIQRRTADANAVNADTAPEPSQPLTIIRVDNPLTFSDWLISVDGVPLVVRLNHPNGSDYRRARDIWNALWVPLLTGNQSINSSTFASIDGVQTAVSYVMSKLMYLEYARMLRPAGTQISQIPV